MKDSLIRLLDEGYTLVPLRANTKRPIHDAWQTIRYSSEDIESYTNLGINHVLSGTVCLDVDDKGPAQELLKHLGLGKKQFPGRWTARDNGWKCLFKAPPDFTPVRRDLVIPIDGGMIHPLEIRGTGQDVLPGSIHPDTKLEYAFLNGGWPDEIPELPDALLELYLNWNDRMPALVEEVFGVPWKPGKERTGEELQGNRALIVEDYNDNHLLAEILEAHGYVGDGSRYLAPGSESGLPGVVLYDDGTCFSNHSDDPLADGNSHDAFDCMRILEHAGDWDAALESTQVNVDHLAAVDFTREGVEPAAPGVDPPPAGFDVFSYDDVTVEGKPPRQLVEDFLLYGNSSLISAQPNTGKSAMALDLAIHVATGEPWHGKQVVQSRVLYVAAESPGSIRARILGHKVDGSRSAPLDVVKESIALAGEGRLSAFRKKLVAYKSQHPDLGLVILDTFRSAAAGADENSQEAIAPIIQGLHECAERLDIHLMIIHHTTKAGATYSGSGVFGAIVDTEIMIKDETDLLADDDNRGCLVGMVLQQRALATKWTEFFYRVDGVKTGRINNFDKEETVPVAVAIDQAALEFEALARREADEVEQATAREQLMDMIYDQMAAGLNGRDAIADATGITKNRVNPLREVMVESGRLTATGSGNGRRYQIAVPGVPT